MKKLFVCLFALCLTAFAALAVAADIPLGPGDVVKISVYNNQDLTLETRVSETGSITFPLIGEVKVGGLTASAAEKKIAGLLESGGFLVKPQVNLIVTMLQSQQVSVLGQVNKPGRYPIDSAHNVIDILALAGGVNPDGSDLITVVRTRNGKLSKEVIDVVDMVRSADMQKNYELSNNDLVYVERAARFYIYGEVQRPGPYRVERSMTVLQALSVGGGLTTRGTERGVRIKRRDAAGNLQELSVKHDDLVQPDDVVYVQESLF